MAARSLLMIWKRREVLFELCTLLGRSYLVAPIVLRWMCAPSITRKEFEWYMQVCAIVTNGGASAKRQSVLTAS
ncbi:hypothetical protein BJV78DRAFT_375748 [Lactifluus subvellereus]|nr:hypothetical protein BJV78DRAFT_375748 [Lactifluus subvellereus]